MIYGFSSLLWEAQERGGEWGQQGWGIRGGLEGEQGGGGEGRVGAGRGRGDSGGGGQQPWPQAGTLASLPQSPCHRPA